MLVEYRKEAKIAVFTLNRPEAYNAVNREMFEQLHDTLIDFNRDENIAAGTITGAGRAFSVGADVTDLLPVMRQFKQTPGAEPDTIMRGMNLTKPLIAAVNGAALGGGAEIALACDIIIASPKALFGFPEVTLGIIPGWGGTQRLPRKVVAGRAMELLLTGKNIRAEEAYRIGLVNAIVAAEELLPAARRMAQTLCERPPQAVSQAKQGILANYESPQKEGAR